VFACMCASVRACTCASAHIIISIQNTAKSCILHLLELPTTGAAICRQNRFICLELLNTSNLPIRLHRLESNNKFNDPEEEEEEEEEEEGKKSS